MRRLAYTAALALMAGGVAVCPSGAEKGGLRLPDDLQLQLAPSDAPGMPPVRPETLPDGTIRVPPHWIGAEYRQDAVATRLKYDGKILQIEGPLAKKDIEDNQDGRRVLVTVESGPGASVRTSATCGITDKAQQIIAGALRASSTVAFAGEAFARIDKASFELKNCILLTGGADPAALRREKFKTAVKGSNIQAATGDPKPEKIVGTGSGFYVSRMGHIVTNHHVIETCREIRAPLQGNAVLTVIRSDPQNDLALLKSPEEAPAVARLRPTSGVRLGEAAVVTGYPLQQHLAEQLNLTVGTVSALAGMLNDSRYLQFSAPVSPGNSGGPVLDISGNVIGVVTMAYDKEKAGIHLVQNVNFMIATALLQRFLETSQTQFQIATNDEALDPPQIGEQARKFTVKVVCVR